MRTYKQIPVWENTKRINLLIKFRNLVVEYFNNVKTSDIQENNIAQQKRSEINAIIDKAYSTILSAGVSPFMHYSPPPVIGGYEQDIDIIHNIFHLQQVRIRLNPKFIEDIIERAVGNYKNDRVNSFWRTINPFYWLFLILDYVVRLPFFILGRVGFNQRKLEGSFVGKVIKTILYLITVAASFLTIFEKLDLLDWFKNLFFKHT
jgi:hypothetical protein